MIRSLVVVAALMTIAIPTVSSAAPMRPGPYVSGFLGVTIPQNSNVTTTVFGPGATTFSDLAEFDPNINVGGTAGYDFGFVRLEGELSYKQGNISTVNDQTNSIQYVNVDGSLGALATMFNAFVDLHNTTPVTPYFGGGIGFAVLNLSQTSGINSTTGVWTPLYPSDNATVFAYQVGAGLEIALNRRVSLDLGYRYFATDKANFDTNGFTSTELKFESHNAMAGVRVKF